MVAGGIFAEYFVSISPKLGSLLPEIAAVLYLIVSIRSHAKALQNNVVPEYAT